MKVKKPITLKPEQLRELKWFCQHVAGTRVEFYHAIDDMNKFKAKIDRLHETCRIIEKFIGEKIKPFKPYDFTRGEK